MYVRNIIVITLVTAVITTATVFGGAEPQASWSFHYFDGSSFVSGRPADSTPYLALQNGKVPVVARESLEIKAADLPGGKGAVAGICYIQNSGSKLKAIQTFTPSPRTPLTIFSGSRPVTVSLSDNNGFYIVKLDPGAYRISTGGTWTDVAVENGKTTLMPLRTGKRMVD